MADKGVTLSIGADGSQADAEFEKIAQAAMTSAQRIQTAFREASYNMAKAMKDANEQMNSSFDKMEASVHKVRGAILMIGSAIAGGVMFKEIIDKTIAWNDEAIKLSKVLGITTEQASILNVALGDIYQTSDTMVAATAKMTKQLRTGEDAFKAIGVATRDQNGNFRNSIDVMLEVNSHLAKFKEGTDRNIEGQKIYGKAWEEVASLLKLNNKVMEEAKVKAKALHLIVGPEGVAQTRAYKAAMNDVEDIGKSLTVQFGNALLPVLTQTGKFMGEQGPDMAKTFKVALQSVAFVAGSVWLALKDMGDAIGALAAQAAAIMSGDFALAKRIGEMRDEQAKKNEQAYEKWKTSAFEELRSSPSSKPDGQHSNGGDKEKSDTLATWKAELERQLEAERNFFKSSLDEELKFWQGKLALITGNSDKEKQERQQVQHEIFALEKRQAQEQLAAELEDFKLRAVAYKTGSVERIQLAGEAAARIGEKYGIESKEYKAALREMEVAAREHQAQLLKLEDERIHLELQKKLQGLEMDKLNLDLKKQLGQITATQELQSLRDLEEQKYQIELQALRDKAALYNADTQEYADAMRKIEEMAGQHQIAMQKINNQIVIEQKNEWEKMMEPLARAIDQSAQGIVMGTTTMQKALANIYQSILAEFISMQTRRLVIWIAGEQAQTAATVAGVGARTTAQQAGAGQSMMMQAAMAIKKIMNDAASTFGGIFAFLSPEMGPAAAGPAAAGMDAVAAMTGSVMSASRGYDIPAGINPVTQLHQQEMVLPAHLANPMRDMLAGGGVDRGDVHLHIHSAVADVRGFETWLRDNNSALVPALRGLGRNFSFNSMI